MAQAPHCGPKI